MLFELFLGTLVFGAFAITRVVKLDAKYDELINEAIRNEHCGHVWIARRGIPDSYWPPYYRPWSWRMIEERMRWMTLRFFGLKANHLLPMRARFLLGERTFTRNRAMCSALFIRKKSRNWNVRDLKGNKVYSGILDSVVDTVVDGSIESAEFRYRDQLTMTSFVGVHVVNSDLPDMIANGRGHFLARLNPFRAALRPSLWR